METYDEGYDFAFGIAKSDISDIIDYYADDSSAKEELIKELKAYFEIDEKYLKEKKLNKEMVLKALQEGKR